MVDSEVEKLREKVLWHWAIAGSKGIGGSGIEIGSANKGDFQDAAENQILAPLLDDPSLFDSPKPLLCDKIEVKRVPDNDAVVALRGQYGLFATQKIKPFAIIGQYCGQLSLEREINFGIEHHKLAKLDYMMDLEEFQKYLGTTDAVEIDCYPDPNDNYPYKGNEMMYINDSKGSKKGGARNAQFLEILRNGWPHIFVVSTRKINEGEEIKVQYSAKYWRDRQVMRDFCDVGS